MGRRLLGYLPAGLWAALLFWLGGRSELPAVPPFPLADKVAHFLAYAFLGILAGLAWRAGGGWPARIWVVLAAVALAAADELHQRTVPGRFAEAADWAADVAGFLFAFLVVTRSAVQRTRRRGTRE